MMDACEDNVSAICLDNYARLAQVKVAYDPDTLIPLEPAAQASGAAQRLSR